MSEGTIKSVLEEKKATTGSWGIGCGAGFLAFVIFCFFIAAPILNRVLPPGDAAGGALLVGFVMGIIACVLGYVMSRRAGVRPLNTQIEAAASTVRECDHRLPLARQRAAELQAEIDRFASWRSNKATKPS